jgi:hypothetical protein
MKKSSLVSVAVFLIVLIALFLGLRIWASARAASFVGPASIREGESGNIYIMSNNILYLHDRQGNLLDRIPMSKFGIDRVIGDFWAYRNGDILLRRQVSQGLTIFGEAEMFARTGTGEKDRLGTGESILQQCSVRTFRCKNFGNEGEVFDKISGFRLFVDEKKGTTFLSDIVGHRLLMLDDKGTVIKKTSTPFQFPNQIVLEDDGLLYVADTNNHRVAAVKSDKENFGSVEKEFKIVHPRDALKPTWPMALVHMPDKKWWVINADDTMSYGTVMILNQKGAFETVVPLPEGADPYYLAVLGDRVLISDPSLMRVYTAGHNGELRDDFGSLTFKLDLAELRRERRLYEVIATLSMWALLILLAGSLLLARQARVREAIESTKLGAHPTFAAELAGIDSGTRRYDYHSLIGVYRIKFAVITVLLLVALTFLFLISRGLTFFPKAFIPTALLGHFVIAFFSFLHLKRSYIEINEKGITFQGMSRTIYSPWAAIRKISVYGSTSRIVTDHGNFSIGAMEPEDNPPGGWLDLFQRKRARFHKELIEEIQKQAPRAKVNMSWIVKYQWKRL